MAEITFNELKKRIAHKLGLVADAEDVPAEYAQIIGDRCLSVQAQLEMVGVAQFVVEFGLEEAYSDAFADLVAAECADPFEIPEPKRTELARQKFGLPGRSPAERRLRAMFIGSKQVTVPDVTIV